MGHQRDEGEFIERPLARFGRRLDMILGSGRVPRDGKRAKAEEAMRAADELRAEIETGLLPDEGDD